MLTARPLQQLAFVTTPLVKLLSISTETVLRLLRFKPSDPLPVTDEEITGLVDEGTKSGIFKPGEDELVRNVFRFADLPCRVAMTHRSEIEWIDKNSSPEQITQLVLNSPHSRFPVAEGDLDHAIGFVNVQDITRQLLSGEPIDLQAILHEHIPVYDGTPLLQVLEDFKERGIHLALIHDEHGSIDGMLTLNDLTDALVGDVPEAGIDEEPRIVRRDDGSWLLDGRIPADEAARLFKLTALPEGDFDTLAGMIITGLGHIPRIGDHYTWQGIRFDVVDMDGKRIDRVLASNAKDGEARPSG